MKKDGMCRGGQALFVTVYVVKARRRSSPNTNHHHHHQDQGWLPRKETNGYNQQTGGYLPYSQKLRTPARRQKPPTAPSTGHNFSQQIVPSSSRKPKYSYKEKKEVKKKPSQSIGHTMNTFTNSFRVQKKPGFMKRLLAKFRKQK